MQLALSLALTRLPFGTGAGQPVTPSGNYVAEDGVTNYVTEDGSDNYVTES